MSRSMVAVKRDFVGFTSQILPYDAVLRIFDYLNIEYHADTEGTGDVPVYFDEGYAFLRRIAQLADLGSLAEEMHESGEISSDFWDDDEMTAEQIADCLENLQAAVTDCWWKAVTRHGDLTIELE